ncbi:MAG: hypothetical protein ACE37B_01225 [Ilumatobacter sp.]|uniref:hypothetical protein n=1 Tax=Ilumatobacter sp. TaxID=1967498 RepID=UPI003918CEFF
MNFASRLLGILIVASLAGCNGSGASSPDETAPPPSRGTTTVDTEPVETSASPASSAADTSVATTEQPTTIAESSTTVAEPETTTAGSGGYLPDDLGPTVDSVPGVKSGGDIVELADQVWLFVPSESDSEDPNVRPPLPEDAEIIAAYGRAMVALYGQVTQNPIPVQPSAAMAATFLDGGEKYSENVFSTRNSAGQYLGFPGDGDVLRPVVIADPRSEDEAFIFDCLISGSHYLNSDGSLAEGEVPGTVLAPLIVRVVRTDDGWIVDDIQDDERACS